MRLARGDMDALAGAQSKFISADFDGQNPPQDIEELLGLLVVVPNFGSAWRHPLFDNTQCRGTDQVPSIAVGAPGVMFGRLTINHFQSIGYSAARCTMR
jgi:hypothetical protein